MKNFFYRLFKIFPTAKYLIFLLIIWLIFSFLGKVERQLLCSNEYKGEFLTKSNYLIGYEAYSCGGVLGDDWTEFYIKDFHWFWFNTKTIILRENYPPDPLSNISYKGNSHYDISIKGLSEEYISDKNNPNELNDQFDIYLPEYKGIKFSINGKFYNSR